MDLATATWLFMWYSIINIATSTLWVIMIRSAPDGVCRMHRRWIPLSRGMNDAIV